MNPLEAKLLELLHSIAMYNDKGHIWYHHSRAESDEMRAQWRQEVDELIAQIGESNFPPKLLKDLRKKAMIQDESGSYAERVSAWFAEKNQSS